MFLGAMSGNPKFGNYSRRFLSIAEVLGAHYVSTYFNTVYLWAKKEAESQERESVTSVFRRLVKAYITGVKTDSASYRAAVDKLHTYFRSQTSFRTLSFIDFQEKILVEFVPEDYYAQFRPEEKDEVLSRIIVDLIAGLGVYMTSPELLRRVIDEHEDTPKVTIRMAQDRAVTILITMKSNIHSDFLRRIGQSRDTVSVDVIDNLKDAIRSLAKDKAKLQVKNAKLKDKLAEAEEYCEELEADLKKVGRRAAKLHKLAEILVSERKIGPRRAAFRAAVPPPSLVGERRGGRPGGAGRKASVPPPNRVGEVTVSRAPRAPPPRDDIGEDFFAAPLQFDMPDGSGDESGGEGAGPGADESESDADDAPAAPIDGKEYLRRGGAPRRRPKTPEFDE